MPFITDPWFYLVAVPAVFLTGISKGGLGLAGGLSVPLFSLVVAPTQAAAIMLPILVVMDFSAFLAYRRHWDRGLMRVILPAGVCGIGIGVLVFRFLDENLIRILIGLIAVGFVLSGLRPRVGVVTPGRVKGSFWGATAGFTSFVAHAGAPPLSVYLLPLRLEPAVLVGTSVVFFSVINIVKLIPYSALGLLDASNLATSLILTPVGAAGIVAGIWMRSRISATLFYRLAHTLLLLTGLKLLYDGIANTL